MSDELPPIERHAATDRFGKQALRTAHDISVSLGNGVADEPVLLRRNGPHRSIGGLEALIDDALADDGSADRPAFPDAGPSAVCDVDHRARVRHDDTADPRPRATPLTDRPDPTTAAGSVPAAQPD